ncbi:MAG: hypothetical protein KJN85_00830 [Maribacter sp.]|nr:hypothetical protein [Maribacter sp.]MBT8314301.1 hypothetical protein [Maribacter sp.]NNK18604.1 hypothetical protein [Maribacter sp.]
MENSVERIKLIDGVFRPAEAADVLLSLINYKIKFHTVQSLNLKSGCNEYSGESEQRILQLKQAKEIVESMVVDAHNKNYEVSIESDIKIKLIQRKQN